MNPNLARISGGKKFLWDGRLYDTRDEASREAEAYQSHSFEVLMVEEGGKFLVYTRRVVKEVVASS